MAIPLIISGAALLSGLFGAKKGYDAKDNYGKAKNVVANAEVEFETSRDLLNAQKKITTSSLAKLGKSRLNAEGRLMKRFVVAVRQVKQVSYRDIQLGEKYIEINAPTFAEMELASYKAADLIKDGIGAVSSGMLTGIGAGGLATQIGVASTGTAISSLTGVAATNATLAWLGGGSLASGGMGMAGGAAVLGGAIAGPVIAVMGFAAAKKSEKALTEAFAREAEILEANEQLKNGITILEEVSNRADEIKVVIEGVSARFQKILSQAEEMLKEKKLELDGLEQSKTKLKIQYAELNIFVRFWNWMLRRKTNFDFRDPFDFNNFSEGDKAIFANMTAFGYTLYAMLKVKVLDDQGSLNPESERAVLDGRNLLEAQK